MNYFRKLIKYMKDSYNIEHLFSLLKDGRKNPTFKTKHVVLPVLFGFILRARSFNELNNYIVENETILYRSQKTVFFYIRFIMNLVIVNNTLVLGVILARS